MKLTDNRRRGLAKFLYDAAKLVLGGVALAPIVAKGEVDLKFMGVGLAVAVVLAIIALYVDE